MSNSKTRIQQIIDLFFAEPDEWADIPEQIIDPKTYASMLEAAAKQESEGVHIDYGKQTWIEFEIGRATNLLNIQAMKLAMWAKTQGRTDLLTPHSELPFNHDNLNQ